MVAWLLTKFDAADATARVRITPLWKMLLIPDEVCIVLIDTTDLMRSID